MTDWKEALDELLSLTDDSHTDFYDKAATTIRAHIEGLEDALDGKRHETATLSLLLEKAEVRVRELEPNASRYLYLRNNTSIMIDSHTRWLTSHRLDAVVDAAIATTEQAAGGLVRDGGE